MPPLPLGGPISPLQSPKSISLSLPWEKVVSGLQTTPTDVLPASEMTPSLTPTTVLPTVQVQFLLLQLEFWFGSLFLIPSPEVEQMSGQCTWTWSEDLSLALTEEGRGLVI